MRKRLVPALLALALMACSAVTAPLVRLTGRATAFPSDTASPRPTHTHRPTQTPEPAATFTARPTASLTPTVPPPVASATLAPAVLPVSPAAATATPGALACQLIWQSPHNGAIFNPHDQFSAGWRVRNTGTQTWQGGSFEFVYLGGARLAPKDVVIPMKESVAPGAQIVLSVPIKAPLQPGPYTTHWGLRQKGVYFCGVTLTISVE